LGPIWMRTGSGVGFTMRNSIGSIFHLILLGQSFYGILRQAEHIARVEEGRSVFKILKGNLERNRSLGRPLA
jgi:hypothetical protein